ncbi:MAG: AraC family transcriptional regulator [Cyanobium sp.]
MSFDLAGSATMLPFIKLPGASLAFSSPDNFGGVIGTFLPLDVHRWDQPGLGQPFVNYSGCIRLGDLRLLATLGSAIHGEVEQRCEAQLVLPYVAGVNIFTIERQTYTFRSSCLFIPAARTRFQLHCSQCSGVVFSFPPETLLPVIHAIGGPGFDPLSLQVALQQPAVLSRQSDPRRNRLHELLMETMAYAERCMAIAGAVNPMLRLDDLIRRLIVMLLVPDLLEPSQEPPLRSEPFVHQALVEWLLAHLHEPISLSDMEHRSSYSRRSLQYAFKQHFGCGPMQWLRQQRLARAKALLEQPGSRRSLLEVSAACGYLSQASFSRDFQARYGDRPSRLLRRSRIPQSAAHWAAAHSPELTPCS